MGEVTRYLGDTERRVSEVDAVSLGLGLTLGFLLGLVSLPLGSVTLSLGVAAGPLVAGVVLGWLERTGPIVWSLPTGAGLTLRQVGVLVFLAAVGLSSGPALADALGQPVGRRLLLTASPLGNAASVAGSVMTSAGEAEVMSVQVRMVKRLKPFSSTPLRREKASPFSVQTRPS